MRVLVIGGAGYIGSAASRFLWERGYDVTVLDLLLFGGESMVPLLGKPRFKLIRGDIRDEETLAQVIPGNDAVCLFAAIVGEPACNRDTRAAVETNLVAARKVVKVAKDLGVKRFLFASTCSNYGVLDVESVATEESPLQPISTYSETKVAAELDVLAAASQRFHPTVLRFSTAFGVSARMRFDLLVSDFTLAAYRDHEVVIYGEQFWRPFVHVDDIASSVGLVLESDPELVSGEVFNIGSNAANTKKIELGKRVARQVAGTKLEFVRRDTDPRSYRVDFSKVIGRLGFRAKWSVDRGIRELHQALSAGVWIDPSDPRYYN